MRRNGDLVLRAIGFDTQRDGLLENAKRHRTAAAAHPTSVLEINCSATLRKDKLFGFDGVCLQRSIIEVSDDDGINRNIQIGWLRRCMSSKIHHRGFGRRWDQSKQSFPSRWLAPLMRTAER